MAASSLTVTAFAGPQWSDSDSVTTTENRSTVEEPSSLSFEAARGDALLLDAVDGSTIMIETAPQSSTGTAGFPDGQPPMIPLPPTVWAGLLGVGGIAVRIVRARRS